MATLFVPTLAVRVLAFLLALPLVQTGGDRFSGTWEGKCQDGRPFVIAAFQQNGTQWQGSVSIANMHGDNEGACMLVLAAPSPEHAQQISDAVIQQSTLSFKGAKRQDGTFARFEMKLTDANHAELRLMNTPVAEHPWLLERNQKAE